MRWASNSPRKKYLATEIPTTSENYQHLGETPRAETLASHMTSRSQSRKETSAPTTSLASPKQLLKLAAWNVRTMYETGKCAQVVAEMQRYGICILGVSEMRWTDSGMITINSGETICYSGRVDGLHQEGVGLILNKEAKKSMLEWEPINSRLIRARFYSKFVKTTVIQCYAPTERDSDEVKNNFYTNLQDQIDKTPQHDILIVMGDFNAKVGADNIGYETCMGCEGLGDRNDNGQRFSDLCLENGLVIGGTVFQHKDIHKSTWLSPDGRTSNQIDHIAISRKWRRSMTDVRAIRGADAGSDHNLVLCKLQLKLRSSGKKNKQQLFDSNKLKDLNVKTQFNLTLKNRFDILESTPADDINSLCTKIQNIYLDTSQEVLGYKKRDRKEWISIDTWNLIRERKVIKQQMLTGSPEERSRAAEAYS